MAKSLMVFHIIPAESYIQSQNMRIVQVFLEVVQ
jgi:hypothetical protein